MVEFAINLLAVLVSGIISMIVGFVWYGPLFGKQWMALTGKTMKDMEAMKSKMATAYGMTFVAVLVMAYVLAHFVAIAGAKTFLEGATVGFWAWLGFMATTQFTNSIFQNHPKKLFVIDTLHHLVVMIVVGGILAVWV